MDKPKKKYQRKSTRLQKWNYGWAGAYFITICTDNRKFYFGDVKNGAMQLSPVGAIADVLWYEIRNHAKHVALGEFIVMPNHVHGILILHGNGVADETDGAMDGVHDDYASPKTIGQKRFQNQGKNTVSSIIGGYKSAVTKHARRMGFEFAWQSRFWDHIIRDDGAYSRIANYIKNNPQKWENDKLNGGKGNVVLEPKALYGEEDWMV